MATFKELNGVSCILDASLDDLILYTSNTNAPVVMEIPYLPAISIKLYIQSLLNKYKDIVILVSSSIWALAIETYAPDAKFYLADEDNKLNLVLESRRMLDEVFEYEY